ncbi:hypothetical protein ABEB36_008651 [Hypothenemus hampei]|uniref:Uncharacterized protein n=1 Tax=Hypothenemus hampei TaxID=57062 RepID=A0ABD1EQI1_HYPHA
MHFWINKGNQHGQYYWPRACRLVRPPPEAVANYLANRRRGCYPKPMVTPVRRFQSLESVSNNGLRHTRSSPGHRSNRPQLHSNAHVFYNNLTDPRTSRIDSERSTEILDNEQSHQIQTQENNELESYIRKFKFALVTFAFLAICVLFGVNYLTTGQIWRLGVETLVIISVALVVLLLGGIIILYLDERQSAATTTIIHQQSLESNNDQLQLNSLDEQPVSQIPTLLSINESEIREMSPPPYHMAVRLTNHIHLDDIEIYQDQSPPPPYEKATS